MTSFEVRDEKSSDIEDIRRITELAFKGKPHAAGDEQLVNDRLRAAGGLSLSPVATDGDRLLGHAAFSPATLGSASSHWFALGPVSVIPSLQGQGIGSRPIQTGLDLTASDGAHGCILTGDPNYYSRFGFVPAPAHCPECEPAEYFMVKKFTPDSLSEKFAFHSAFYGDAE
ncbi:MAG: putative acetyltransferase [Halioglobus sp.]|jgi:putative acetyltransferase